MPSDMGPFSSAVSGRGFQIRLTSQTAGETCTFDSVTTLFGVPIAAGVSGGTSVGTATTIEGANYTNLTGVSITISTLTATCC